jgi:hypothetical protein
LPILYIIMSNSKVKIMSEVKKIYLDVPFQFKNEAKELGAKWDSTEKRWYTLKDNVNRRNLVDLYHYSNFTTIFVGPFGEGKPESILNYRTTTKKQRKRIKKQLQEEKDEEHAEYERLQANWISKCGNLDGFGIWYSVNILNHD